ncbi:efflux RND transporter periplasmic adaptor subunit [Planctomycetaceae bacterium SH139]
MRYVRRSLLLVVIVGLCVAIFFAIEPAAKYWQERNRPLFRTVSVSEGEIIAVVNSTGTVKPVSQVTVGSFVSGPIAELFVEFNQQVDAGEVLAKIDPRLYEASVARDQANLATREAEVERITADLQLATNEESRASKLLKQSQSYLSESEFDRLHFNRKSLEAQLRISEAAVAEAIANLQTSQANLEYCSIRAPVKGTVIDRKIDPGQTLAAQFQTPELFIIAPDMQKEMHVFASVDEADIGLIRAALEAGKLVEFTVDAYPDELFTGKIWQVRQSSTVVQNVVTYPVIVSASNEQLKLMPGMTANLSFEVDSRELVLRVPNSALRFYPDRELVHPDDQRVLDGDGLGADAENLSGADVQQNAAVQMPAGRLAAQVTEAATRHVWYEENGLLRAIEVKTGISDYRYTEVLAGDLAVGQALVIGIKPKT